jgi:hypothetical protein
MQIVSSLPVKVESLSLHPALLPSVDELRPRACPACCQPAFEAGKAVQIVGHGTYERQVLGVAEATRELVVRVRRYLCRGCARTISVLPDELYPRRWYAAGAILLVLFRKLFKGETAAVLREQFGVPAETPGWRTLQRWCRQLLAPLWSWFAKQLGIRAMASAAGRLRRLLGLRGLGGTASAAEVMSAARSLITATVHDGREGKLRPSADARSDGVASASSPAASTKTASTEEVSPADS